MEVMKGSNSIQSRKAQNQKEKPKLSPVASGTMKKKSKMETFIRGILSENIDNIGSYIVTNVVIPVLKDSIFKIGANSWAAIFGKSSDINSLSSATKYHRAGNRLDSSSNSDRIVSSFKQNVFNYNDIVYRTIDEANNVLQQMADILEEFPTVSVSDMLVLSDQAPNNTSENWGWTNVEDITNAKVVPLAGGGYSIRLPKAKALN